MGSELEAGSRLTAFGNQLIEVHIWLREQLEDLRDNVDAYFAGEGPPPRDVRAELEGLAAIMETHFVYEEKKLTSVLNGVDRPQWRADRPNFLLTGAPGGER